MRSETKLHGGNPTGWIQWPLPQSYGKNPVEVAMEEMRSALKSGPLSRRQLFDMTASGMIGLGAAREAWGRLKRQTEVEASGYNLTGRGCEVMWRLK